MPKFSERAQNLPASPIRKLVPYADAAKERGTHVYHLNIGQPDIPTPPAYFKAIQDAEIKTLAYSPSAGTDELREQIAAYYGRLGHEVSDEQVIVTTGASEALGFVFATMLNPGDEVIIPEPFYGTTFRSRWERMPKSYRSLRISTTILLYRPWRHSKQRLLSEPKRF